MKRLSSPLLLVLALLAAAGCATTAKNPPPAQPADQPAGETAEDPWAGDPLLADLESEFVEENAQDIAVIPDPLKPWNKIWFHVNDKMYFWMLRPVAKGYGKVMPKPARTNISHFIANLKMPVRLVSCLFQGRFKDCGVVLARFGFNSTVGVFGLLDPAEQHLELAPVRADLDQAFGVWGLGTGPYLVWPFTGPSSLRGTVGSVGDGFLTPTAWFSLPAEASISMSAVRAVNHMSFDPDAYKDSIQGTADPYSAVRSAYFQYRKKTVDNARQDPDSANLSPQNKAAK